MRLFIAEKPSMGREISKCLPEQSNIQRRDGYIIQGDDVVTWAFGHVLEQAEPGDYDEKYKRWNAADLPIVPQEWKLLVTKSSEKQFHTIKNLISKADIIVNAGDPDREGQLLIDEILTYVNNIKPVQRILLNALDEKSVKAALGNLRDNKEFFNLKQSALARSRADWLIGMNLSRAYTIAQQKRGNRVTLPIGRVKTPTLALVVRRERELKSFKPVDYFTLKVLYSHKEGDFWATWQPRDEQKGLDSDGRLLDRTIADDLVNRLRAHGQGLVIKASKTKKKEQQRLPLSLSALQVLAGKAFSYDPQTVLDIAQKLYERKLTTYPRSDCDYLPTNQFSDSKVILRNLITCGDKKIGDWATHSDGRIKSRAWNDKKITAHHAIIPTTVACKVDSLSPAERNIYFLIAQAYIAQFYPEHEYEQTKLTLSQCDEEFVAHGRVVIVSGWKSLYQRSKKVKNISSADESIDLTDTSGAEIDKKKDKIEESSDLPPVKKGDSLASKDYAIDKKATKPPTRFTASTLLQAMKEIHKFVKNEDLKKQLKAVSGIGTEATRATIIDELINRNFIKVSGKKKILQPTQNGYLLVDALPEELLYPDETAVWEERLSNMSEGTDNLDSFLADQVAFLQHLIDKLNLSSDIPSNRNMQVTITRTIKNNSGLGAANVLAHLSQKELSQLKTCPSCGKGKMVKKSGKFGDFLGCSNYPKCKNTEPLGENVEGGGISKLNNLPVPEESKQYLCPRCKQGYFVKQKINSRVTWVCSNRSVCRTQCADVDGKPVIFVNKN